MLIPTKKADQLAFCESHWPVWLAEATNLSLTAAQVNVLKSLTVDARTAYDNSVTAKNAARAAIGDSNIALSAAVESAAELIKFIKAHASQQTNPDSTYTLAQLPIPQPPQPAPPPGQPEMFTVELQGSGAITLRWKAKNATPSSGAFFTIMRKLYGETTFSLVGTVGAKTFTDATVQIGTTGATYQVTAMRGLESGMPSVPVTIQFGVSGGGGGGVSVTNATLLPMKMAA